MFTEDSESVNSIQPEIAAIELQQSPGVFCKGFSKSDEINKSGSLYDDEEFDVVLNSLVETIINSNPNREAEFKILNSFKVNESVKYIEEIKEHSNEHSHERNTLSNDVTNENDNLNTFRSVKEITNEIIISEGVNQDHVNGKTCNATATLNDTTGASFNSYRVSSGDSNLFTAGSTFNTRGINDAIQYFDDNELWYPFTKSEEIQNSYLSSGEVLNPYLGISEIFNPYVRNSSDIFNYFESCEAVISHKPVHESFDQYLLYLEACNHLDREFFPNQYSTDCEAFNQYFTDSLVFNLYMEMSDYHKPANEVFSLHKLGNMTLNSQRTIKEQSKLCRMGTLPSKLQRSSNAEVHFQRNCKLISTMNEDYVQLSSQDTYTDLNPDVEDDLKSFDSKTDWNLHNTDPESQEDLLNIYSETSNLDDDDADSENMVDVASNLHKVDSNSNLHEDLQSSGAASTISKNLIDLTSYDLEAHSDSPDPMRNCNTISISHKVECDSNSRDDFLGNISVVLSMNESGAHPNLHDTDANANFHNPDIASNVQRYCREASKVNNSADLDFLNVEGNANSEKVVSALNLYGVVKAAKEHKSISDSSSCEVCNSNRQKCFDSNSSESDCANTNRHAENDIHISLREDYRSDIDFHGSYSSSDLCERGNDLNSESTANADSSLNKQVNSDLNSKEKYANSNFQKNSNMYDKISASSNSYTDSTDVKCSSALNSCEKINEIHFKNDDTNSKSYSAPFNSNTKIDAALVNIGRVSNSHIKISGKSKSYLNIDEISNSQVTINTASNCSVTLAETQNTYVEIFAASNSYVKIGTSSNSFIEIDAASKADVISGLTEKENAFKF